MSQPRPNVGQAGLIMVISLFLSRVLGLVRDATIAGIFGADLNTDLYRLAFSVPDLIFFLIAGGALSSAFIPVFSDYFHRGEEDDAWHVFSAVTTVMSVILVVLITAAWILAEPLSRLIAPGKPDEFIPVIATMSRIVLPAQFAFFIGGLMFGTLYARQVFSVPGLGPNIYNLGIIFGAVALSGLFTPGVIGMSWGATIGAFIGNLLIPFLVMRKMGAKFRPTLDTRHPGVRKVFRLMLPVVLGLSLPGVYGLITQAFASFYVAGVNTWLDSANRLMQAPLGVFGQSLAIAVFPALAQFYAQQRMDLYRDQLAATLRTVLYITVPISLLMAVFAPEIVQVLLTHGPFDQTDAAQVAWLLQLFSLGIFAWCLHPVLMRGFFAVQSTVVPIVIGTLTTVVFVSLVFLLRHTPLAYGSLALSSSISAILLATMLLVAVRAKIGGLDMVGILTTLGKAAVAAVATAALCQVAVAWLREAVGLQDKLMAAVTLLGLGLVAFWIYFFLTRALGMPETKTFDRVLSRLGSRKPAGPKT